MGGFADSVSPGRTKKWRELIGLRFEWVWGDEGGRWVREQCWCFRRRGSVGEGEVLLHITTITCSTSKNGYHILCLIIQHSITRGSYIPSSVTLPIHYPFFHSGLIGSLVWWKRTVICRYIQHLISSPFHLRVPRSGAPSDFLLLH